MPHGQLKILSSGLLATGNLEVESLIEVRAARVPMDGGALVPGTHASPDEWPPYPGGWAPPDRATLT